VDKVGKGKTIFFKFVENFQNLTQHLRHILVFEYVVIYHFRWRRNKNSRKHSQREIADAQPIVGWL